MVHSVIKRCEKVSALAESTSGRRGAMGGHATPLWRPWPLPFALWLPFCNKMLNTFNTICPPPPSLTESLRTTVAESHIPRQLKKKVKSPPNAPGWKIRDFEHQTNPQATTNPVGKTSNKPCGTNLNARAYEHGQKERPTMNWRRENDVRRTEHFPGQCQKIPEPDRANEDKCAPGSRWLAEATLGDVQRERRRFRESICAIWVL